MITSYPEERVYNAYGEMTQLRTFRGGGNWSGSSWPAGETADTTTWVYQDSSGLLTGKTDAANQTVSYTYTNRMVRTRAWARGIVCTNTYSELGDLVAQEYNDSNTPNVAFNNWNRAGLPREIIDGTGTNTLAYDHAGRLVSTTCEDGIMAGITVSNHFDGVYGRDRLEVNGVSAAIAHDFGYDANGRLSTVAAGTYSATYGYVPNSDLLQTTTFKTGATPVMTTTRRWEYGMRLGGIVNEIAGGAVASSHSYGYDAANRRTRAYLEDGSVWIYGYNDRDELVSAKRYWNDWLPYSGQQFGYLYDNIGNRQKAWSGGDNQGGSLRQTDYTANGLNQYTLVQTPGYRHIAGVAFATNSVTVNTGATERRGEWFDREIAIANGSGPVWQNVAVTSGGVSSNGGFVFPKNSQTLAYDADGNLTSDGVWTYV